MNAINWGGGSAAADYEDTAVMATVSGGSPGPVLVSFYFNVYNGYTGHHVASALKDAWNASAPAEYAATVILRQVRLPTTCAITNLTIKGTAIPNDGTLASVLDLAVYTQLVQS
jgi:hypothetical protein